MKKRNIFTWAEHLLIAFYIALFSFPALVQEGYNLGQTFLLLFKTTPSNYLLYITPVFLYLFIKRTEISEQEKTVSSICINLFTVFFIYTEFESGSGKAFYITVAILILSLVCININDFTSSLILLPGLFVTKLGLFYLFTAYFPVLFLLMLKTSNEQQETQKKKIFLSDTFCISVHYAPVNTSFLKKEVCD